ncbi:AEC family transporter [Sphaerotilus sp.]|uniref:AEC family transporter n=1 Tax=Sphaerotilus sp. TaxID=2093942 RepID=UPI0034E28F71
MLDILSITFPIYLIIAVGYLLTRLGVFAKAELKAFGKFVIQLALPALLFNALSQRRIADVLNISYLLVYAAGSLVLVGAAMVWARRLAGKPWSESAVCAMGMACPNSGFVGYPIMLLLMPAVAGVALALNMLVENLILLPLLLALADRGDSQHLPWYRVVGQSLARLATNPMIIGLVLGFLASAIGWQLPAPLARTVTLFAQASSALSLFVIGGALHGLSLAGMGRQVGPIMAGKLVLHPLCILGALATGAAFGLPALVPELRTALVMTAAMPIMGIYPILAQRHGHEGFSAAALLGTTLGSFLTLNLLLWMWH